MFYLVNVLSHSGGGTSFDGPWYVQIYNSMVEFFELAGSFIDGFVEDIITVTELTSHVVSKIPSYLAWLPSEVVSVLALGFVVVGVYMLLNRK